MHIKQLPLLIANQIAAGEVIERPASVLKELLENSIDAGSTIIDITLEQGGCAVIKVSDNGHGIYKEELQLAATQHATSKIYTIEDLDCITSLGFRGEALASIGSVSNLEIHSKPIEQEVGWMLDVTTQEMQPIAHHNGSTIIVKNLFYNTPARKKFLRSTVSEFNSIEELFKRIALSNFNVTFSITHNNKKIKSLPLCTNETMRAKRLSMLCGEKMLKNSLYIEVAQNEMYLHGWLGLPHDARTNNNNQLFYINNRMIKDKLINHAIKQAYQTYCDPGKYPTYCLYFEIDPKTLDVNVHPTKHEVRFRDARIIHAFLTTTLQKFLEPKINCYVKQDCTQERLQNNFCISCLPSIEEALIKPLAKNDTEFKYKCTSYIAHTPKDLKINNNDHNEINEFNILCVIKNAFILAEKAAHFIILDINAAKKQLLFLKLYEHLINNASIPKKTLLIPQTVSFINYHKELNDLLGYSKIFETFGFKFDLIGLEELLIREIPVALESLKFEIKTLLIKITNFLKTTKISTQSNTLSDSCLIKCLSFIINSIVYNHTDSLLSEDQALQLLKESTSINLDKYNHNVVINQIIPIFKPSFKYFTLENLQDFFII